MPIKKSEIIKLCRSFDRRYSGKVVTFDALIRLLGMAMKESQRTPSEKRVTEPTIVPTTVTIPTFISQPLPTQPATPAVNEGIKTLAERIVR